MLIIPPGFFNLTVEYSCSLNNRLQSSALGFSSSADGATVLADFITAYTAHLLGGSLANNYAVTQVRVDTATQTATTVVNEFGTSGSDVVPPNCCVNVTKYTAMRGHAHHGVWKLPAGYLAEADVDDGGNITGAAATAIESNIEAFLVDFNGSTSSASPVLLHDSASSDVIPTVIQSFNVELLMGKIGRRLRGRGSGR